MPFEPKMNREEYRRLSRLKSSMKQLRSAGIQLDRSQESGILMFERYARKFVDAYEGLSELESQNIRVTGQLAAAWPLYLQYHTE